MDIITSAIYSGWIIAAGALFFFSKSGSLRTFSIHWVTGALIGIGVTSALMIWI